MRWWRSTSELVENSSSTTITTGGWVSAATGALAGPEPPPQESPAAIARTTARKASAVRTRRDGSVLAMSEGIGIERLKELIAAGTQLVEVLPEQEFEEEHLPGAINLPLKKL